MFEKLLTEIACMATILTLLLELWRDFHDEE